jgi:hypothetical protein
MKVALIIIYNHRFDQNIEVLEKIYASRFSHIFHLMPFYNGDRPNVIPVYENSYYFQGFIAQAFWSFYREDFTHYFFIADDMILNPRVNERNFAEEMPLPPGFSFIPNFNSYNNNSVGFWTRVKLAYEWKIRQNGLQITGELPPPAIALEKLKKLHLPNGPLRFEQIWETPKTLAEWASAVFTRPAFCLRFLASKIRGETYDLSYPLVGGYSDIFVVTADAIKKFSHYCGVFAAGKLFVEHAIPTALVLSTDQIITCPNMKLRGKALWNPKELRELEKYGGSLAKLLQDFPPGYLYLHPIKLSRWITEMDAQTTSTLEPHSLLAHTGYKNQIENLRLDQADLCFTSTGSDPYLFLPKIPLNPDSKTWVSLEITVPAATPVQLFHQTIENESFNESRSEMKPVPAGRHQLIWTLSDRLNGHFRLDPGSAKGEYRIHGISFQQ